MDAFQKIEIRSFEMSDYQHAVDLWSSIDGLTLNESDGPGAISVFLKRNPKLSFVAKSKAGELIGTVLCGHNGRAGHIYHLAVAKSYRGQGLGRHLVGLCFDALAKENIPRCNIFVYSNNDLGNSFWLASGWNDPKTWKVLQKYVQA
ncbi:MAG TPA: GNAT family N-acetyltransferase [Spongiibacteraceae bacterium]|jgi:putative acetyltransferase